MASADPRSLRKLLDAVMAIGSGLELAAMLQRIAELATELAGARYGALGVLDETGDRLAEFITIGIDDATHAAIGPLPEGHGILGLLILDARPIRLPDLQAHPDSYGFPPGHPPMHTFLGVPIVVRGKVFGNLYLTEKEGGDPFTDVDEELVVGLAAAAGVAIENARLHARVSELLVYEDRERIARDLHDTVIQRIFATGLSLQGTASLVHTDAATAANRIEAAVDDLDETVKQVRSAIFSLQAPRGDGPGLRDQVLGLCREAIGALGFAPDVVFGGPLDAEVPGTVLSDLTATLREALSNVARHAGASRVDVAVDVDDAAIRLRVTDDGVGPPDPRSEGGGNGLINMAARAARHGGRAGLRHGPPRGTVVDWWVPRG